MDISHGVKLVKDANSKEVNMSGWGNLFGKIADQFQGRIERLRNEKGRLENERNDILGKSNYSISDSKRIGVIDNRLREISEILANSAK